MLRIPVGLPKIHGAPTSREPTGRRPSGGSWGNGTRSRRAEARSRVLSTRGFLFPPSPPRSSTTVTWHACSTALRRRGTARGRARSATPNSGGSTSSGRPSGRPEMNHEGPIGPGTYDVAPLPPGDIGERGGPEWWPNEVFLSFGIGRGSSYEPSKSASMSALGSADPGGELVLVGESLEAVVPRSQPAI